MIRSLPLSARRALAGLALCGATVLGLNAQPALGQPAQYPYEPAAAVVYESNCCNAWVEGRTNDALGRPVNGALVKVRGRDGWETVSRPSGGEMRSSPEGIYFITLRAGPEQMMDYSWTVWMVDPSGQPLSPAVEVYTDQNTTAPDSRQVIHLDFRAR